MEQNLNEKETTAETNRCPGCGSNMEFNITSGNLRCGHCGTTQDFDQEGEVVRRKMCDEIVKGHQQWTESAVFRCDGCGAKSVIDRKEIAKPCCWCGSPHVVSTEELPGIKPDSVIPFQVTTETARNSFFKWIKRKFFAPNTLKRLDNKNEFMNQMYSSSWSYSANTVSNYSGTLGRRVAVTRTVNGQTQTTWVTRWFNVNGVLQQPYKDFIVPSCVQIPPRFFDRIKPFNLTLLKVYRQEFLSGIVAEHYSRCIQTCFTDFSNFVRRDLTNKVMRLHNADSVSRLNLNTIYNDKHFNYILLPVYVANYKYKNKRYNFYVNGASGKVAGAYPKSVWKILFSLTGVGLIILGIAHLFSK